MLFNHFRSVASCLSLPHGSHFGANRRGGGGGGETSYKTTTTTTTTANIRETPFECILPVRVKGAKANR